MTISEEERWRLLGKGENDTSSLPKFQRSGLVASLLGMLAGLGMLVLVSATLGAGAILLGLQFDLTRIDGGIREMSVVGITVTAVVLLISTFVGGFVAGRTARYGGIRTGLGSSLWLMLVLAVFTGLTIVLGAVSGTFDGFGLADRFARFGTANLRMAAAITGSGLFVLVLLGGLVGGRLGETREEDTRRVVDIRDVEAASEETETESQEQPTEVREPEADPPEPVFSERLSSLQHEPK